MSHVWPTSVYFVPHDGLVFITTWTQVSTRYLPDTSMHQVGHGVGSWSMHQGGYGVGSWSMRQGGHGVRQVHAWHHGTNPIPDMGAKL